MITRQALASLYYHFFLKQLYYHDNGDVTARIVCCNCKCSYFFPSCVCMLTTPPPSIWQRPVHIMHVLVDRDAGVSIYGLEETIAHHQTLQLLTTCMQESTLASIYDGLIGPITRPKSSPSTLKLTGLSWSRSTVPEPTHSSHSSHSSHIDHPFCHSFVTGSL